MRTWQEQAPFLQGETLQQTKANINNWLNKFEQLYTKEVYDITILYGLQGYADVNTSSKDQGGPSRVDYDASYVQAREE